MGVLSAAGINLPAFSSGSIMMYVLAFLLIIFAAIVIGVAIFFAWRYIKYNMIIELYKTVGSTTMRIRKFKGGKIKISNAGDYWIRTIPGGKIIPKPKYQIAKNTYQMFEREDGEWIPFEIPNIDQQMHKANVHYVDDDMRFHRVGIERNLAELYKKTSFWDKYGTMLMSGVFILILTICLVILFKELKGLTAEIGHMASSVEYMAQQVQNMKGTGLIP